MNFEFNFHSARARKSRLYVNFSDNLRNVSIFITALIALAGLGLWISDLPVFGSLLLAVASILAMPLVWYDYDIKNIRPIQSKDSNKVIIEEAMHPEVVGRLHDIDSPYSLWRGVKGTWQQRFFCMRYGIDPQYFESVSKTSGEAAPVLADAWALSQKHESQSISAASILVALLKTLPDYVEVLANLQLDLDELESSIDWIHHNQAVLDRLGKTRHFGGLARDWTSGFTPMLNQMAHNMSEEVEHGGFMYRDLDAHAQTIAEMIKFMSSGRQNVLLVGEVGAGKTITTYGFTQKILMDPSLPEALRYHQVFLLNASSIIAASGDANQVEATVTAIIAEAQKAKNTILFFDDAASFFSSGTGAVNLGRVMLPIIQNGAIPAIFAMTPSEWQAISANNQALAGMMNYLAVPEADATSTLRILEDYSLQLEARHKVIVTYQALKEAINLADRYVRDVAAPGQAITLLENSVNHADDSFITAASVQQTIEATLGVKVQLASGVEKEALLNLEDEIHKRMINQTRAVKVVSDALRRARSGVNNPNKPLGTFLFLGPTGVGKTELSKAVAATYFGDEAKMVRVDMNEFTQSADIERLLDVSSSTSFLSAIGRNRFTVVLFDEIEKAHPEVINVFLQLLDEGIMRDANNKEVSFRDAIVIATSNAGAETIRSYIDAGYEVEQFEQTFVNSLIDGNIFKPEFLNRFDETVVFRPLKPDELMQVTDLLMASINANLSRQKVAVDLTPAAKQWLVDHGNDPRLGARPLRRMVQRTVENVVAKRILQSDFRPGSTLTLDVPDLEAEAVDRA